MKFTTLATAAITLSLSSLVVAHDSHGERLSGNKRHAAYIARQNLASGASSSSAPPAATSTSSHPGTSAPAPTPAPGSSPAGTSTLDANVIPPISQITANMPVQGTVTMFTTFTAGATPPISGAPPLPTIAIVPANYPALDLPPPTNSSEVQGWLSVLKGANIPNNPVTKDGSCASSPELVANATAAGTCWWTCGGCLRETDISTCPDKNTWGVSYDDGPSPYTPKLLNYLNTKDLKATFFVVGSRVISRPEMLQTEYMLGHEISVHTWSHTPLTSQTNEEIVAELGWTKKAIKDVIGVTPTTFRPPYGDLDDRVRAVAAAMGLTPIQWTGSGANEFDTDDWKIPGGTATGPSSYAAFTKILDLASQLSTGFIVLEHDLYQQTVDMALGYFLPMAYNRSFTLEAIYQCLKTPLANTYVETKTNSTGTGGGNSTSTGTLKPTTTNSLKAGEGSGDSPNGALPAFGLPRGATYGLVATIGLMIAGGALLS